MPCLSLQLKYRLPFLSLGTNGPKKNHYYVHSPWMILGECYLESALYKGKGYTFYRESFWGDLFSMPFQCFFARSFIYKLQVWHRGVHGRLPVSDWVRLPSSLISILPVLHSPWRCFKTFGHPGLTHVQLLYRCITAQKCDDPYYSVRSCLFENWDPVF